MLKLDFTGISPDDAEGFELIPVGTYVAKVIEFRKTKSKKTGAPMFETDFEITDGQYAARRLRYWSPIMDDKPFTKANFLLLLKSLGVLLESDQGPNGELSVEMDLGVMDDFGKQDVRAVIINGATRKMIGKYGKIVVENRKYKNPETQQEVETSSIKKVESADSSAQSSAKPTTTTRTPSIF